MKTNEKQKTMDVPRYAWVILGVTMLAGVSAPLNQFKVPPVMPVLMERFQLDLITAGLLMSIFAITGLVLALPAGIILHRLGPKTTGLIAIGSLLGGSILGALTSDANGLLFSRLIEGVGMGLIAVVSPAVITLWFPPQKRGLAMGIWATWVSLGSLIIYNLAPALNRLGGWQTVWWGASLFTLAAFILYGLLVRVPPGAHPEAEQGRTPNLQKALNNRAIWLLALSFGCFNFAVIGVIATYYPTFLTKVRGYTLADASFVTSIKMIVVILIAPLAGWLSDWVGSPKRVALVAFLGLAAFMAFPFSIDALWQIVLAMAILGFLAGAISSATFSAVPAVMGKDHLAGLGMAVVMVGQNVGQLLGPVVFSRLVESIGWTGAGYWMVLVGLVGFGAMGFIKMR
jgi:MFS family permease